MNACPNINNSPCIGRAVAPVPYGLLQQGVSLIELMIAMTLGLVLVIGITSVYLGAKRSVDNQAALATVQENARYAFEFLGNDVRMAGFSGGPADATVIQPVSWNGGKDLQAFPLRGFETGVSTFPSFPVDRPRLRGDVVTMVYADTDNELELDPAVSPNPSATVFTLKSWPSPAPAVGGLMVASDYTRAAGFGITAIDSGAKTLTTANSVGGFSGSVAARRVCPLKGYTYYIANNPASEPSLYRLKLTAIGGTDPEEVVEGVSDMQITYGVDYADPAAATIVTTAAWSGGVASFASTAHGLTAGDLVSVSGVNPNTYNGSYRVAATTVDSFSVLLSGSPGAYISGGTVRRVGDRSVDGYWTADAIESGSFGGNTIPGDAIPSNYWKHVLSVRFVLTLTTKQNERISTEGTVFNKVLTTTFSVRNRL